MRDRGRKRNVLLAVVAGILLSTSMGCGRLPAAARPAPGVAMAMSDSPREPAPAVAEETLHELVSGNNAFAFDLYRAIREEEGNLFCSPYSISAALAMAYAGARGETERQMAGTLHYSLAQDRLHPAFNALDLRLVPSKQDEAEFRLQVANSTWGQEGFPFLPGYLDTLAVNYGAGLRLVDFTADGKREEARQAINRWVSDETEGLIEELIEEDILSAYTRLVLANAIYFKGEWQDPFKPKSADGEFHLPSGKTVTVPMMSRRAQTRYAQGEGWQAVELPYKGERVRMLVLLPDEGGLEALEQSLGGELLEAVEAGFESKELKLYLPRFDYEAEFELAPTLAEMGMPDAFDDEKADLSGMYERAQEPRNLFLSQVVHKAFVAVDEKGTEAAAATGVVADIVSLAFEVRVDRPFIFLIRDSDTGTVFFVGRVVDPSR